MTPLVNLLGNPFGPSRANSLSFGSSKADIFVFLKYHLDTCRFPGMPRTGNGYNRKPFGTSGQFFG
jgi:hypothetical protein